MMTLPREIERAVALVNLDDRSAASIATVLEACGERDVALTAADARAVAAVCDRLRAVFATTDRDAAAVALNDLLAAHAGPPRLVRHASWDWHVHVDRSDDAPWDEWLAASAALALATRLVVADGVPWGTCAADGCGKVFVHDGRGGARHWCSTTCATRERVRRHRAVRRDPPERAGSGGQGAAVSGRTRPGRRARGGASATG
jgi:predicted RNA-binding Zn ribbon-like protein